MKQNTLVVAIVSGAICFAVGFIGGALLTMPDREKTKSAIAAVEAKAEKEQTVAQQEIKAAKEETERLRGEQKSVTTELKEAKAETAHLSNELKLITAELTQARAEIDSLKGRLAQGKAEVGSSEKVEELSKSNAEIKVINNPIFGIHLGQPLASLAKTKKIATSSYHFEDSDYPAEIWDVANSDPTIKTMRIYSFDGYVFQLAVNFRDASEANYEAVKKQLAEKYGEKRTGLDIFGESDFYSVIDGVEIGIRLNRDDNIFDDDTLELIYYHRPLYQRVSEELNRRKAAKVRDKL
jgi:uncharacterized protein (UPF0335 family)